MPIPAAQELRKPLLEALKDGHPHNYVINDLFGIIAAYIGDDPNEMSSGDKNILKERVKTARDDLKQNGLISSPSKNTYLITNAGLEILNDNPAVIDDEYLTRFRTRGNTINEPEPEQEPEPINFLVPDSESESDPEQIPEISPEFDSQEIPEKSDSPAKALEDVLEKFNADLAGEILNKVAALPSDKFEKLVIDLLSKMGYRAFQNARYTTEAFDAPGEDCIHGVILESEPGLTPIYIQARKLSPSKTISKNDIQDFISALNDKGGKGLFATTASFSEQAAEFAKGEGILLIDGNRLANLMITSNFCVSLERTFTIKSFDSESFSEYEE